MTKNTKIEIVGIKKISLNTGQIEGLPQNPRFIKDAKFKKLVESIKAFPEMLNIRPIVVNEDMVILGGNMRYRACLSVGLKNIPIIIAKDLTLEETKQFLIKDNVGFGEWDWDVLANKWEVDEIIDWGLDVSNVSIKDYSDLEFESIPEFEKEELSESGELIVYFSSSADRDSFEKLIGQKITPKTKSVWFNAKKIDNVKDLEY
tara:strand:- start:3453 stop:4064 length:612 start_codon:yes stop_codon:yes gene_type:complete